ncbi:MAG TPA: hypothetical protein PKB07_05620 [Flavilitoribacter sp.]|nr:hypothetical protein [Flavilitoribacter sp.]
MLTRAQDLGVTLSDYCENALVSACQGNPDWSDPKPALIEEDLGNISIAVSQELENLLEVLQDSLPAKGDLESLVAAIESQSQTTDNNEEDDDKTPANEAETPVYDPLTVVDTAELPNLQKNNLKVYIRAASEKLKLSEQAVMIRMMAYAYGNLAVKGGLFYSGLDGVGEEVLERSK